MPTYIQYAYSDRACARSPSSLLALWRSQGQSAGQSGGGGSRRGVARSSLVLKLNLEGISSIITGQAVQILKEKTLSFQSLFPPPHFACTTMYSRDRKCSRLLILFMLWLFWLDACWLEAMTESTKLLLLCRKYWAKVTLVQTAETTERGSNRCLSIKVIERDEALNLTFLK